VSYPLPSSQPAPLQRGHWLPSFRPVAAQPGHSTQSCGSARQVTRPPHTPPAGSGSRQIAVLSKDSSVCARPHRTQIPIGRARLGNGVVMACSFFGLRCVNLEMAVFPRISVVVFASNCAMPAQLLSPGKLCNRIAGPVDRRGTTFRCGERGKSRRRQCAEGNPMPENRGRR